MARNEEKAMAALNRWHTQKKELEDPYGGMRRPKIASEVATVKECEHWRGGLIRGVSKKIAEIQNAALGEHRIRDLNDEINKELREKNYWDVQIKALGGPDHAAMKAKEQEANGEELSGNSGYKYFGAAKDLPGVRELFEKEEPPEAPRKTRKQLFKGIQPDYYGWRDDEDGMLGLVEAAKEHELVELELQRWKAEQATKPAKKRKTESGAPLAPAVPLAQARQGGVADEVSLAEIAQNFKSYVDVPTMQDIERLILEKKKQTLLKRYASGELLQEVAETSAMVDGDEESEATPGLTVLPGDIMAA